MTPVDERAKQILFATVDARMRWQALPPKADLAYARSKRMLFAPVTATHDEVIARLVAARTSISRSLVTAAFVASLSSRRLDLRSGLTSYVLSSTRAHPYKQWIPSQKRCECGLPAKLRNWDLDSHNCERHRVAGFAFHSDVLYRMLDLEELAREAPIAPTKDDVAILQAVLVAARNTPAVDGVAKLNTRLRPVLGGTKHERTTVLDALAACGVLAAEPHGSESCVFAAAWRGKDGVDAKRVKTLFGRYGVA